MSRAIDHGTSNDIPDHNRTRGTGLAAPSRRTLIGAAAWSVPVVVVTVQTPAHAASTSDTLTVSVRPSEIASGESASVVARVRDVRGNAVAGRAVAFAVGGVGGVVLERSSGVTDVVGMCSTVITMPSGGKGGEGTVTAISNSSSSSAAFTAYAVDPDDTLTVRLQPSTLAAGESCSVVVQVRDAKGDGVGFRPVSLTVRGVSGATLESVSGKTDVTGMFYSVLTLDEEAQGVDGTVVASSAGTRTAATFTVRSSAVVRHSSDGSSTTVVVRAFGAQSTVRDIENRYMQHSDWQPTARYVRKGDVVAVTVPSGAPVPTLGIGYLGPVASQNNGADVGIGAFPLAGGQTNRITADRDGVVYLYNLSKTTPATVTVTGGVPQPVWVRGETTDRVFTQQMTDFSASPFVTFISTWAFADVQRRVVSSTSYSPAAHVDRLEDVFLRTAAVYGLDPRASGLGRKLPGAVYIAGPDSGSGYANAANGRLCFQVNTGASRDLLAWSGWAHWHETGHTFQTTQYTWGNLVEVTVNISSLAVQAAWGQGNRLDDSGNQSLVQSFFAKPVGSRNFDDARSVSPFLPLFMFDQLRRAFGDGFYPRLSQEYRFSRFLGEWQPSSDQEKRDVFALRTAKVANRNLAPFFEQWGVVLSDGVKAQMGTYPALATQPWTSTLSSSTVRERTITYDLPVGTVSGPGSVPLGTTTWGSLSVSGLRTLAGGSASVARTGVIAPNFGSGAGWVYAVCDAADGTRELLYRAVDVTVISGIRFTGLGDNLVGWISLLPQAGMIAATSTGRAAHVYFRGQSYYSVALSRADGTVVASASVDGGADNSAVVNALNGVIYRNGDRLTISSREPGRTVRFENGTAAGALPATTYTYTISGDRLT